MEFALDKIWNFTLFVVDKQPVTIGSAIRERRKKSGIDVAYYWKPRETDALKCQVSS